MTSSISMHKFLPVDQRTVCFQDAFIIHTVWFQIKDNDNEDDNYY